jgi:hypothetical protein
MATIAEAGRYPPGRGYDVLALALDGLPSVVA